MNCAKTNNYFAVFNIGLHVRNQPARSKSNKFMILSVKYKINLPDKCLESGKNLLHCQSRTLGL